MSTETQPKAEDRILVEFLADDRETGHKKGEHWFCDPWTARSLIDAKAAKRIMYDTAGPPPELPEPEVVLDPLPPEPPQEEKKSGDKSGKRSRRTG